MGEEMFQLRSRRSTFVTACLAIVLLNPQVNGQIRNEWASKPIKIVIPKHQFTLERLLELASQVVENHDPKITWASWHFGTDPEMLRLYSTRPILDMGRESWRNYLLSVKDSPAYDITNIATVEWIHGNAILKMRINNKIFRKVLKGRDIQQLTLADDICEILSFGPLDRCGQEDADPSLTGCPCNAWGLDVCVRCNKKITNKKVVMIGKEIRRLLPSCVNVLLYLRSDYWFYEANHFPLLYPFFEGVKVSEESIRKLNLKPSWIKILPALRTAAQ